MTTHRSTLLVAAAVLALAACGGERDAGSATSPSAPFGFELALAATSDDAAATTTATAPMIDLTPEQLAERIRTGKVRVIDVRTDAEVAEGTIPGAEHMPLDRFDPAKLGADDGREIVLYCRSGRRSAMAGAMLAEVTGKPVEHLAGGMLAWEAAGQPVEKR